MCDDMKTKSETKNCATKKDMSLKKKKKVLSQSYTDNTGKCINCTKRLYIINSARY